MAEKLTTLAKRLRPFIAGMVGNIASSGALMTEGPDIDLVGDRIGRGGDTILLFDSGGNPVAEFAATEAGFALAQAAWTSGDVIEGPLAAAVAFTAGITLTAGVLIKNFNFAFSGFSGVGITLADNVDLQNLRVIFDGAGQAEATAIKGTNVQGVEMTNVYAYGKNATTNRGMWITGISALNNVSAYLCHAQADGGTNCIALDMGDGARAHSCFAGCNGGSAYNYSILFSGTETNSSAPLVVNCFTGGLTNAAWGGVVDAGKTGRAVGSLFDSAVGGMWIKAGGTLYSSSNYWSSLLQTGTLTFEASDMEGDYAPADLYVNGGTGNDTTGTGAVGAPYATLARALKDLAPILTTSHTIHVADGTYAEAINLTGIMSLDGAILTISGNTTTPANVTFTGTFTDDGATTGCGVAGKITVEIEGIRINVTADYACKARHHARLTLDRVLLAGTVSYGLNAFGYAQIILLGNITISGFTATGILATSHSIVSYSSAGTLTITGPGTTGRGMQIAYNSHFYVGWVNGQNVTITGVATGVEVNIMSLWQHYSPTGTTTIDNASTPVGSMAVYVTDCSSFGTNQNLVVDNFETVFTATSASYTEAIATLTATNYTTLLAPRENSNITLGVSLTAHSSGLATDVTWDTKGDLIVGTGSDTASILPVGTDGQVLIADSGEATGLKWDTISTDAVTLDADAEVILDLTGQEIGLDVQNANTVFAGPTTGAANEPTFRALVAADIPSEFITETETHEHINNDDLSAFCDGVEDTFPTSLAFRDNSTQVYLNGLRQRSTVDYNESAGLDSIVFVTPPEAGDIVIVDYIVTYADYQAMGSLLLESGDYLLTETGDKLLLE